MIAGGREQTARAVLITAMLFGLSGCAEAPHADEERVSLAGHASLFMDREAALEAEAVAALTGTGAFRRLASHEARFGYTRAQAWFLLHPPPAMAEQTSFHVLVEPALLDEVSLFRFRDGRLQNRWVAAEDAPHAQRPVRGFGFRVADYDGRRDQLLLGTRTQGNLAVNGWLLNDTALESHRVRAAVRDTLFLSAMLPLVILNLLLFAVLRSRSLLYLSLFAGATVVHHVIGQGLLADFAPNLAGISAHRFYLMAILTSGLAAMLFTRHALILPRANPMLDRIVVGFAALIGASVLTAPFAPLTWLYPLALASSLLGTPVLLVAAAIRWRQGDPTARILTFTWSILLLGIILMAGYRSGWLVTPIITESSTYLLSVGCVLLLTFAIVHRLLVLGGPYSTADPGMVAAAEAADEGDRMISELERRVHRHNRELRVVNDRLAAVSSETERHALTLSALFASSVAIHRTDDIDELLITSLGQLGELFPDHGFGIIIHGDRLGDVRYRAFLRIAPDLQRLMTGNAHLLGESSRSTLRSLLLAAKGNEPASANQTQHGGWQFLEMPDRSRQAYGHLIIQGADLAPRSVEVLSVFCSQISTAIENRRLSRELEELANTDPLTQIGNRKVLDSALADAIRNATSAPQIDFCVLVADVNSLKPVNDTWGHEAGDKVIIHVARVLADCVRREDTLARMGGDEFVILCPNARPEGAEEIADRIHRRLELSPLVLGRGDQQEMYNATVSMGIASSLDAPPDQVLAVADSRMYDAKERHYAQMASRAEA